LLIYTNQIENGIRSIINIPLLILSMLIDITKYKSPFILFGNGEIPKHKIPIQKLKQSGTIISVDGGADKLKTLGLQSHIILGDLDSLKNKKSNYDSLIIELKNQNKSDLEKSLQWCISKGIKKLSLLGFSGKRDDHAIASILLLNTYSKNIELNYYSDYCKIHFLNGNKKFKSFQGQIISILSINSSTQIKTKGLKYALNNDILKTPTHGISNISLGKQFSIKSSSSILITQNYKK